MWHPSLPAQPGTALLQPFLTQQHPRSPECSHRAQPGSQGYTEGTQEAQAVNAMSETCQGSWCISNWACSEGMMSLLPLLWRCRSPRQARGQLSPDTPGCQSWLYKQRAYTRVRPSVSLTPAMKKLCCSLTFRGFIVCLPAASECVCLNYTNSSLFTHQLFEPPLQRAIFLNKILSLV